MIPALNTAIIVAALVVAAWAGLAAARDRPPDLGQFVGLGVLQLAVVSLVVVAVIAMIGGERATETETFIGYLITTVCFPAVAGVLGRMEPTRWGSVTIAVACLIIPVLVLRLAQVWG